MPFGRGTPLGPDVLDLDPASVDLWVIPLPPRSDAATSPVGHCSWDERAHATRFRTKRASERFLLVRSMVRDILSRYARGYLPADLVFTRGPYGKPHLREPEILFNVSHTQMTAVCCVAREEVGIDLERIRRVEDPLRIARDFFTGAEADAIRSHPAHDHPRAFFHLWSRKEACAKALGLGTVLPFWSFTVGADTEGGSARPVRVGGGTVWLRNLPSGAGWASALASLDDRIDRIRLWRYASQEWS